MERVDVGTTEELVAKGVLLRIIITGGRAASCSHKALHFMHALVFSRTFS
jgi:hypothetical protein